MLTKILVVHKKGRRPPQMTPVGHLTLYCLTPNNKNQAF